MICEVVSVVALALPPRPLLVTQPRRVCLHQLLARARREGAVVVDLRAGKGGRVWTPETWSKAL